MGKSTDPAISAIKVIPAIQIKLKIKGHEHELTEQEARDLKDLLAKLFGDTDNKKFLEEIRREVQKGTLPPVVIPWTPPPYVQPSNPHPWRQPEPIPQWPTYTEIWCGTSPDSNISLCAKVQQ